MNVRRLVWFVTVEIDTVRATPDNCWHVSFLIRLLAFSILFYALRPMSLSIS